MGITREEIARLRARVRAMQTDMLRRKAWQALRACPACKQLAEDCEGDPLMMSLRWHTPTEEERREYDAQV